MTTKAPWEIEWLISHQIGNGGQGTVDLLEAKDGSGRQAVLKQIVERWRSDPQARQRLIIEAETLKKLHKEGAKVPNVYSATKSEADPPYIVMEFISGLRFDNWLKQSQSTDLKYAIAITKALSETIELCHRHSIGHRDIKPTNIILKDNDFNEPYVIDFGISFDSLQTYILTREGEMFWNEFLILPECQDLIGGDRDLRSDITALAGIFFTCLTGKPPGVLRDSQDRSPHKRHFNLLSNANITAEQKERLIWFFDTAFAYRISERFQSLKEFIDALCAFSDTNPEIPLDLDDQFQVLNKSLLSKNRSVQLGALGVKSSKLLKDLQKMTQTWIGSLEKNNAHVAGRNITLTEIMVPAKPSNQYGDLLGDRTIPVNIISIDHYQKSIAIMALAFSIELEVHIYVAAYLTDEQNHFRSNKHIELTKVAVFDTEDVNIFSPSTAINIDDHKKEALRHGIRSRLAREVRNLTNAETS